MSFITSAFFIFFFYFCASSTNGQQSFILHQRKYPGACPQLPDPGNYRLSPNMIKGRWYIIRSGLLPTQAKTLTCELFDISSNPLGSFNILLSVNDAGKFKIRRSNLIPTNTYGTSFISRSEESFSFQGVFLTVNSDFFIYASVACKEKTSHTESLVVGVRKLPADPEMINQIDSIIQKIERTGFQTDVTEISHPNCAYPPPE